MGVYESSFGIRVARVLMMLCLPVAILLGLAYLRPETAPWQALLWAFGVTWLMDQVGSFAMFYRRQQMSYKAERWFLRLNLVSTIAAKLYLMPNWYSTSMCWRVALGAGLLAAFGVAKVVENLWDTHFRVRPRIRWEDARCVYQCQKLWGWLKRDKEDLPDGTEHFQAQAPPSGGEEAEVFEVQVPDPVLEDSTLKDEIHRTVEEVMAEKNRETVAGMDAETVVVQCSFLEMMRRQASVTREPDAATLEWPGSGEKVIEAAKQQAEQAAVSETARAKPASQGEVAQARPPTRTQVRLKPWEPNVDTVASLCRTQNRRSEKHFLLAVIVGVFLGQAGLWLGTRVLATLVRTNYWLAVTLTIGLVVAASALLNGCLKIVDSKHSQAWLMWAITALAISGGLVYAVGHMPSLMLVRLELNGITRTFATMDLTFASAAGLMLLAMPGYCWRLGKVLWRDLRERTANRELVFDWKRGFEQVDSLQQVVRTAYGWGR